MTHHPLAHSDAEIHSLARFQTLQAGQYWRALDNVPEEGIDAGMVLLIQSPAILFAWYLVCMFISKEWTFRYPK